MMLLAIDTSTRVVGVALYDGIQVVSEVMWVTKDYHTVELAPAVDQTLSKVDANVTDINAIAVALGPGSYTGLRIGIALVKGLSLVGQLPVVGIPTFDILAAAQPVVDRQMVTVLRAGRGRLAAGWYRSNADEWESLEKTEVITPEQLSRQITKPTLVCGELTGDERKLLGRKRKKVVLASPARSVRRPSYLAELGWERWCLDQMHDPVTLSPIYLHYNQPIPG
jgi:tRNA threonylcarbamoyladenosine biosynthesis protein TsaB